MKLKENAYKYETIEEIAKGFKRASDILRMEKPSFILVPVAGSVPFVDLLNIVDRKFNLDSVAYIPNSSRFENRKQLMADWYANFFNANETGEPMKLICIDEVLSGSSAIVGYKQFQMAIEERAKKKSEGMQEGYDAFEKFRNKLKKQIDYKILGIAERGHIRNPEFNRLDNSNLVHLIEFSDVPMIDNITLNPLRFKVDRVQKNGKPIYLPEIERFEITPDYMNLLHAVAEYVGVDPANVNPVNLSRIEKDLKTARPARK